MSDFEYSEISRVDEQFGFGKGAKKPNVKFDSLPSEHDDDDISLYFEELMDG